jgi:hypothetical protein
MSLVKDLETTGLLGLILSSTLIPNFLHYKGENPSVKHIDIACLPRSFALLGDNLKVLEALSYSTKGGRGS